MHKHFLWIVLITYFIAAVLPGFGLWIRDVSFGDLVWFDKSSVKLSLPLLMLSFLLFDAALGVKTSELRSSVKYPLLLFIGLVCNVFIPIILIFIVADGIPLPIFHFLLKAMIGQFSETPARWTAPISLAQIIHPAMNL